MSPSPEVTVVIVAYNSMATIDRALRSLQPASQAGELRVVLVDNASADTTAAHVRANYDWVCVVDHGGNHGFARGCNKGFEQVTSPYVLFLNPDAALPREGLRALVDFLGDDPVCGVVAPAILYPGGVRQLAGMMATPWGLIRQAVLRKPFVNQRPIEPGCAPFATDWVCGAAFLIRSDLYRQVGMMDPRYFLYFEETDLWRAVRRQGRTIWVVGAAVAEHAGGVSARDAGRPLENGCLTEFYYPSRFYYLGKNFGWVRAVLAEGVVFSMLLLRIAWRRLRGLDAPSLKARLAGGLFRLPAPLRSSGDGR